MALKQRSTRVGLVLVFTVLGFLVMGYHPGLEDDGIYLAAVKASLNPALFPHNSAFFRMQTQATVFPWWMAHFAAATHMSIAWSELLWQIIALFAILWACHGIARRLFDEPCAMWAGVALVAAMFTLPVTGTALYLVDQHLHPRTLATACILLAVERIMTGRRWQAAPLLLLAFLFHPIMAALGISFCVFLALAILEPAPAWLRFWRGRGSSLAAAAVPLAWVFAPANAGWRMALDTRTYYFLYKWTWYEWLGALAPLFLFWLLWRVARRREETRLARFALAVFAYGVFQQCIAFLMLTPPALVRLTPWQPMRYLHLVYFFLVLLAGCLLGKYLLKNRLWLWAIFLVVFNGGMLVSQLMEYSASPHLEMPWTQSSNPWLQAFAWVRRNTPVDAYFALNPSYLAAPGEDRHGFRALAERSQLADAIKDAAVVTQIPELGPVWERQVDAQKGWPGFRLEDFERLKTEFGVDWVVVSYPQPAGLICRWHNRSLAVCQIP